MRILHFLEFKLYSRGNTPSPIVASRDAAEARCRCRTNHNSASRFHPSWHNRKGCKDYAFYVNQRLLCFVQPRGPHAHHHNVLFFSCSPAIQIFLIRTVSNCEAVKSRILPFVVLSPEKNLPHLIVYVCGKSDWRKIFQPIRASSPERNKQTRGKPNGTENGIFMIKYEILYSMFSRSRNVGAAFPFFFSASSSVSE